VNEKKKSCCDLASSSSPSSSSSSSSASASRSKPSVSRGTWNGRARAFRR
jgi:hypothetical protein